jgi:hypothetical protein
MVKPLALVVAVAAAAGCAARARPGAAASQGDDVTLYRDVAVVRQRVTLELSTAAATITVPIAAEVAADQVIVLDRGEVMIDALHVPRMRADEPPGAARPTELALEVRAPRAGRYHVVLGYTTDRLRWEAGYTLAVTAARDRGVLRGALAVRNDTGMALRVGRGRVIDAELRAWRVRAAESLVAALAGTPRGSAGPAPARELGAFTLGDGEARVELLHARPRHLRTVLVYDPIGTRLDHPHPVPRADPSLGISPPAGPRVTESFELARDAEMTGLPAGTVRLLERRPDGVLQQIGEARLFDAASRVATVDTIAVGWADGVTGKRERRELTLHDQGRKLVEEFVITLVNDRPHPIDVVVREHLYRGLNWYLPYASVPTPAEAKEGPQQIALRTRVPARATAQIYYVVVYTSGP